MKDKNWDHVAQTCDELAKEAERLLEARKVIMRHYNFLEEDMLIGVTEQAAQRPDFGPVRGTRAAKAGTLRDDPLVQKPLEIFRGGKAKASKPDRSAAAAGNPANVKSQISEKAKPGRELSPLSLKLLEKARSLAEPITGGSLAEAADCEGVTARMFMERNMDKGWFERTGRGEFKRGAQFPAAE